MKKLVVLLYAILLSSPQLWAQDTIPISRTNFMVDAGYGIHSPTNGYKLSRNVLTCGWIPDPESDRESEYSKTIGHFADNAHELAAQLDAIGAGYFILNMGQSDGKYASPNSFYQKRMNVTGNMDDEFPGGFITAKVSLPAILHQALEPKGIKLFLYFNVDGPSQVRAWKTVNLGNTTIYDNYYVAAAGGDKGLELKYRNTVKATCRYDAVEGAFVCRDPYTNEILRRDINNDSIIASDEYDLIGIPVYQCHGSIPTDDSVMFRKIWGNTSFSNIEITNNYVENISEMIKEWSEAYGDRISGWMFDHASGDGYYNGGGFTEAHLAQIRAAALAGNSEAIVAFARGTANPANQTQARNLLDPALNQDFHFGEVNPCVELDSISNLWLNDEDPNGFFNGQNVFTGRRVYRLNSNDQLDTSQWSQNHTFTTMGTFWGRDDVALGIGNCGKGNENPAPLKDAEAWSNYLCASILESRATTISVGNVLNRAEADSVGIILNEQFKVLENIRTKVKDNNCQFNQLAVRFLNKKSQDANLPKYIIPTSSQNMAPLKLGQLQDSLMFWQPEFYKTINGYDTYRLFNIGSKKYMTIKEGSTAEGADYQLNFWNDWSSQKWIIEDGPNQTKRIKSFHNLPSKQYYATPLWGMIQNGTVVQNNQLLFNDGRHEWYFSIIRETILGQKASNISMAPNPARKDSTIELLNNDEDESIVSVQLYNIRGEIIDVAKARDTNSVTLDIRTINDPMVFVRIETNKDTYFKKLLIED